LKTEEEFKAFIGHVCDRPNMYAPRGNFEGIAAFIHGWATGGEVAVFDRPLWRYICLKLGFPTNYLWSSVIKNATKTSEEAIALTKTLFLEFLELKDQMTPEELDQHAFKTKLVKEEGAPEKIFRKFDRALLRGKQSEIEQYLIPHENAHVLWQGAYPTDVSATLNDMANNQPIRRVYESEDNSTVRIIAAGWPFEIEIKLIGNNWKIDAKDIIKIRSKNKA
jgi:hypothetical protein